MNKCFRCSIMICHVIEMKKTTKVTIHVFSMLKHWVWTKTIYYFRSIDGQKFIMNAKTKSEQNVPGKISSAINSFNCIFSFRSYNLAMNEVSILFIDHEMFFRWTEFISSICSRSHNQWSHHWPMMISFCLKYTFWICDNLRIVRKQKTKDSTNSSQYFNFQNPRF